MKIKSQRDFWAGAMFLAIGLAFAWASTRYPFGSSAEPGPGYFPFGLGVLLALLGAVELFKSLAIESEGGDPVGTIGWKSLVIVVASVALFGYTLPRLGLFIALPLLVVMVSVANDQHRWLSSLAGAALLTAGCWVVLSTAPVLRSIRIALPE